MRSHGLLYKQWHRQDSSSFLLAGEQSTMLIMARAFQSLSLLVTPLSLRDEFHGHDDINTWVKVVSPHLWCNVYDNNNRALSVFVFYKCLIWHLLKITQTIHSQVSVSSRYPPCLDSFHGTFLSDSNSDIFVPVGTVTLGLGWAIRTTSTTWIEPPGHQGYLWKVR